MRKEETLLPSLPCVHRFLAFQKKEAFDQRATPLRTRERDAHSTNNRLLSSSSSLSTLSDDRWIHAAVMVEAAEPTPPLPPPCEA